MPAPRVRPTLLVLLAFLSVIASSVASAGAQSINATLSGRVVDAQDAAVPAAAVSVTDGATLTRAMTTNDEGLFLFAEVPPGRYRVTVERSGFATQEVADVVLTVGDQRTLRISLPVAGVNEQLSVTATATSVREAPSIATVITRRLVENQPLNGRTFQSLVLLAPGTVLTGGDLTRPGQFSVNGQRANTNYVTVDGVSANFGTSASVTPYESGGGVPAYSVLGSTNSLAAVDAVEEFSVQTSGYTAESGRQPGAQVAIVTRSGASRYAGSLFGYFRDAALDANNFFANLNGLAKPDVSTKNLGGVAGGPIGKRTFFFVSYEGMRVSQPFVTSPLTVPSLAARASATGTIRQLLDAFPLPTGAALANDPTSAPYIGAFANPSTLDATSVRLDRVAGDRLRLFARYNYAPSDKQDRALFCAASCVSLTEGRTETTTGGATWVLSPRLLNDARVNVSRAQTRLSYFIDDFGGAVAPPAGALYPTFTTRDNGYVYIQVDEAGDNTLSDGLFVTNRQRQVQFADTLTWTNSTHTVKAGVDYRRLLPVSDSGSYRRQWNPNSIAGLTRDVSANATIVAPDYALYPIYQNLSLFVQDSWRAGSRLTLNVGLRYDVNPAPTEANGRLPLTVAGLDTPSTLTLQAAGARLYDTDYRGLAPRLGVTYAMNDRGDLLVRGNVGVFYDLGTSFIGNAFSTSLYPVARSVSFGAVSFTSPSLAVQPPAVSANPPYPRLFAYQDQYRLPYSLHYSAGLEKALSAVDVVSAAYVGSAGRRLGRVTSLRNPSANFTRVDVVTNDATSDYHSLQLQYQRRATRGLSGLASYTLAKAMDIVSDESINNFQALLDGRLTAAQDRGPASFDVRHSVNAALSYDLPSAARSSRWHALLSDFGIDGIVRARSALPVNVISNRDPFGFRITNIARPDLVPGVPLYLEDASLPGGRRFNPAAFDVATPLAEGRQGTLGRNALRGFPAWQIDLSARRRLAFGRAAVLLRLDAFNLLNRANFANPSGILTAATFGRATQMLGTSLGGLSPLFQVGGPRALQLSARVQF